VEANSGLFCHVCAPSGDSRFFFKLLDRTCTQWHSDQSAIIYCHSDGQLRGVISHDIDWPHSGIQSRDAALKVDKWSSRLSCFSQTEIVRVKWIGAPIAISQEPVRAAGIVIWAIGYSCDAQGYSDRTFGFQIPCLPTKVTL
jgi:hypothetical protein